MARKPQTHPLPESVEGSASPRALDSSTDTLDTANPVLLNEFVQVLFDRQLDWYEAVREFLPHLSKVAAWNEAERLQTAPAVEQAVGDYVKRLSSNSVQLALLLHTAWRQSRDGKTGAVQATALNILAKAHITERSEHDENKTIRVEGAESIRAGITGVIAEELVKEEPKGPVN